MQITVQVPAPPVPPLPPDFPFLVNPGPSEAAIIGIVMIVVVVVAGVVLTQLVRAFGRRAEARSLEGGLVAELEQLRNRVEELEAGQARVAELEERVDFSERLLAQSRDAQPRARP